MRAEERRRSDRVSLLSAIRVTGIDPTGEAFSEEGRTVLVTLHGAAILLRRQLLPEQQLSVRCYGTGGEAKVRVVGQIEEQPEGGLYGVKFLDPGVNPWNIKFPPLATSQDAVVRLLLQCSVCQGRELVYLDELESEVFGANQCLTRHCVTCGGVTLWKETPHELPTEGEPSTSQAEGVRALSGLLPRTRNDRRHIRLKVKFNACVRHAELGEEEVVCEHVSRGGVCFTSRQRYPEGALIKVAVPYTPGQANIFTAAEIANVRESPNEELTRYGVAYLHSR